MSDEIDDVIKKVYSESDIPNMDKEILDFLKSMLEPDNIELKTHINKKKIYPYQAWNNNNLDCLPNIFFHSL